MSSLIRRNPLRGAISSTATRKAPAIRPRRTLVPAPTANSGPLLSRRADRDLPALSQINNPWHTWRHLPLVLLVLVAGGAAIFNYEKLSHSVVTSSLYALRVHARARGELGDEIYFAQRIPWISGSIDPMHGKIDVWFGVKGTKGKGVMRFRALRVRKDDYFKTDLWTLQLPDGQVIDLLEEDTIDPISRTDLPFEEGT